VYQNQDKKGTILNKNYMWIINQIAFNIFLIFNMIDSNFIYLYLLYFD